jgi:hypothetical protein
MDDSSADRFKEPGGIACLAVGCGLMCVVFFLLAQLAREVQTHESRPVLKSKLRRVDLHAIDAMPARWRGDTASSPLDGGHGASTAASSPRNDLVKN